VFLAVPLTAFRPYAIIPSEENQAMNLKYTYEMDGSFYVGCLDDYPEYPTQGENLKDFEENLLDIYEMIQDGTLDLPQKHGVLEISK